MLEAVKMRLTSKDAKGAMFTFEGKNIPDYVVLYFQSAFPDVEVVDADEEPVEIIKSDWFKEIESKTTPAESLKLLRTTFGYTQQQLADKVGITKQQISAMERGREPIGRKAQGRNGVGYGAALKFLARK
jgi:hypothetical protein